MNRARSGAGSIPSARESAAVPPRIGASSDSVFARIPEQNNDSSDAHRNTLPGIRRRMGGHTEAFMEQTPTDPVEELEIICGTQTSGHAQGTGVIELRSGGLSRLVRSVS